MSQLSKQQISEALASKNFTMGTIFTVHRRNKFENLPIESGKYMIISDYDFNEDRAYTGHNSTIFNCVKFDRVDGSLSGVVLSKSLLLEFVENSYAIYESFFLSGNERQKNPNSK